MASRSYRWGPILVAAGVATAVAFIGGGLTDVGPWYQALRKPSWQPPDWAFAPAWTVIFALTAAAAVVAWNRAVNRADRVWIIVLFVLNGALNILWSFLFFHLQRPDWALLEVGLLWLSVLVLVLYTARNARLASLLLLPYLAWVTIAGYLNLTVVRLNAPF